MIQVGVEGIAEAGAKLDRVPVLTQEGLRVGVSKGMIELRDGVKVAIESIFHSDGPLYSGIKAQMEEVPGEVTGRVYTTGVPYDAAQEYGGTWTIPEIFPVTARALAFMAPGKMGFSSGGGQNGMVFAMHTKAHPVTLPARSYARSTLFRMRDRLARDVREATLEKL